MSKPIYPSETEVARILEDVKKTLTAKKSFGSIDIKLDLKRDDRKARLIFSPTAWVKQKSLVEKFDTEVEWHGLVNRVDENTFEVYDILVPPHTVAAATVTADYEKYTQWINDLSDDVFFDLHFHGHSHVNMGTTPSGTDMKYREDVVTQIPKPDVSKNEDGYYIFMILNKSGSMTYQIFDLRYNAIYDTADITVDVDFGDGQTMSDFITEAQKVAVKAQPTTTFYTPGFGQTSYSGGGAGLHNAYCRNDDDDDFGYGTWSGGYIKSGLDKTGKK